MSEERIWLWKNSEEGKPEYVAYDNPWPIGTDHDDPLTLGEPAGWAYLKPSRDGSAGRTEEMAEAGCLRASRPAPKADGQWTQGVTPDGRAYIQDEDFTYDARLYVDGDFPSEQARAHYVDRILAALKDRDVVLEELLRECRGRIINDQAHPHAENETLLTRIDTALKERV